MPACANVLSLRRRFVAATNGNSLVWEKRFNRTASSELCASQGAPVIPTSYAGRHVLAEAPLQLQDPGPSTCQSTVQRYAAYDISTSSTGILGTRPLSYYYQCLALLES